MNCNYHRRYGNLIGILLGVLLCVLIGTHAAYAYDEWSEDDSKPTQTIAEGTKSVTVAEEGEIHSFAFTPKTSGYYLFYEDSDDPDGAVRAVEPDGRVRMPNASGEMEYVYSPEFRYGVNCKWFLVRFKAVAGKTYYLDTTITWSPEEKNVSYTVRVKKDPYVSVKYTPKNRVELLYDADAECIRLNEEDWLRAQGQFVFTKADGTTETYKYYEDSDSCTEGFAYKGKELSEVFEDWRYYSSQDWTESTRWKTGKHEYTVYIRGMKITVPVYVVSKLSDFDDDQDSAKGGQTAAKYTIKYNLNGGKGTFKNQTKKKGKTLTLNSKKPTKSGYTFQGWATKKNGKVSYKAGAKYTANKSVTLYAVWKKNAAKTYTVKYNLNGGKGTFKNQTKKKGKALTLNSKKPTKSGYAFQGWATKKNGKVVYKAGAKYTKDQKLTLYAVWKKAAAKKAAKSKGKVYVLIYGAAKNGGPSSTNNVNMVYRAMSKLEIPGYTFNKNNIVKINVKSFKKGAFNKAVKSTFKNAGKNDLCIIYLNTHSKVVYDGQQIRDYYTGKLTDKIDYPGLSTGGGAKNYYSWQQVLTDLGKNVKGQIIFMPEVCNSEWFIKKVSKTNVKDRIAILAAAKEDLPANQSELYFFGGGHYTQAVCAALGTYWKTPVVNRLVADGNKDGKVTIKEIYTYIQKDRRIKESGQSPKLYLPKSMKSLVIYKK